MHTPRPVFHRALLAGFVGLLAACAGESTSPSQTSLASLLDSNDATVFAASARVRCERRTSPNRSKISVDGRGLVPSTGTYSARVRAIGGTVRSPTKQAIGGQAEFDFDSNPNDIAQGATPIAATFIVSRNGPDVLGEILDVNGQVVARQAVQCNFR